MAKSHQQFAEAVLRGFVDAGLATDQEIGAAGGPSTSTMTKLRKVAQMGERMAEPRNDTFRRIDTAANWMPGSARNLWAHGHAPEPRRPDKVWRNATSAELEAMGLTFSNADQVVRDLVVRMANMEERLTALESHVGLADPDAGGESLRRLRNAIVHRAAESVSIEEIVGYLERPESGPTGASLTPDEEALVMAEAGRIAARQGRSGGRSARAAQDADAEGSQDPGGETGA